LSGVAVIRSKLATNANLIAAVPATRIMAGELPLNTVMPAIQVTEVSSVPRLTLAMTEPNRMHTDRVQVTVLVKAPEGEPAGEGYPHVREILALVLAACPNQSGTVNGVTLDSIIPDIEGPDLADVAAALYSGSRDFMVKWKSS
jgi:hypothetical protein